jgi:hypothetical protein
VNVFSRLSESGPRDEYTNMRVALGDAMVARERRCEYILRAKKTDLTMNTYMTSNRFFLFFTSPHPCMRAQQPNHFVFQDV